MRAYSVYDREAGPMEGAVLVFAPTGRDARSMARQSMIDMFDSDWGDIAYKWLPEMTDELQRQNGVSPNALRVIESPVACERCEEWGRYLDDELICESCREDEGDL